ncbi:MAG TPA: DUF3426 domain-containing protein [Rhizomicrobium sp.]|nr:DUF3426 domain-containing protein [Rhizomicrobium sp.]
MILTCPACSTRYQVDEAKFPPQGRSVRCAKCGHVWHQPGPQGEQPPEPAVADASPAAVPESHDGNQTDINQTLARFRSDMAAKAHATAAAQAEKKRSLVPLLGVAAGWAALIAAVLLIGYAAVRYRQEVAVIWPQSAGVYEKLGLKVNTEGLDFVHVDYHREGEDGEVVLAVTGQIVNNAPRELPVPQSVRVSLADSANHEIYHWSFTAPVQSLKPGQSAPFTTRLSSPPAGARHLEVRFAPPGS